MANRNKNKGIQKNSLQANEQQSGLQNQSSLNIEKQPNSGGGKTVGQGSVAGSTGTGNQSRSGSSQGGSNH